MNNGKICISVCGETADEFIEKIRQAEESADVIELRFDCLLEKELVPAMRAVLTKPAKKIYLITFRPKEQGGKQNLNLWQRLRFWQLFFVKNKFENIYVDFEFDINPIQNLKSTKLISSFHIFSNDFDFESLNSLFEVFSISKANIWKIATQADEISDTISIWKLLEKAKAENQPIIPIAMGESGKWTRILGLANGAFMTYASLESGSETASGQISARDLIEIYRVKELNEQTEIYGIVGNPVSQSVSPEMHNAAFKFHNLNAVYIPFEVKNLEEFLSRMIRKETREIDLNFSGFSVTIPHKQSIIEHLDFVDETALAIGAVNTVKIFEDKLYGCNTDAEGFIEPLKTIYGDLKNARIAVLGAGGAAHAAVYALKKEDADVTIFARNMENAKNLADEFSAGIEPFPHAAQRSPFAAFDILVNTTPLGMKGKFENETPVVASQIENLKLVYDLVYNPFETRLIKEARKANVPTLGGLAMLVAQGMKQFKIWTGTDAPIDVMSAAALRKLNY